MIRKDCTYTVETLYVDVRISIAFNDGPYFNTGHRPHISNHPEGNVYSSYDAYRMVLLFGSGFLSSPNGFKRTCTSEMPNMLG